MRGAEDKVRRRAVQFAGRFGFITRDIFFEYLCTLGRSQKFSFWKALIDEGWLISRGTDSKSAYLSKKARNLLAPGSVPARSKYFIEHDKVAANLLLELETSELVIKYWTERELAVCQYEALSVLGCRSLDKIPDLVVDLNAAYGHLRVAVEVERAAKAKERYEAAALSYLGMRNVDLILYVCRYERTADLVKNAFAIHAAKKSPGIFVADDFFKNRLGCTVSYRERSLSLVEFLALALKRDLGSSDANRTVVRRASGVGGKAA